MHKNHQIKIYAWIALITGQFMHQQEIAVNVRLQWMCMVVMRKMLCWIMLESEKRA